MNVSTLELQGLSQPSGNKFAILLPNDGKFAEKDIKDKSFKLTIHEVSSDDGVVI